MIERRSKLQVQAKILLTLTVLIVPSGCLDGSSQALQWESIKAEIRDEFPSVTQLSTQELEDWLARDDPPLLLDARSHEEYAVSHLQNAILAPSKQETRERLAGVELDRPIVVYCSVGYRSSRLAEALGELGYTNVYNLEGSIFQWANEGRAVYRGNNSVDVVHPYDGRWGQLLKAELWSYSPEEE